MAYLEPPWFTRVVFNRIVKATGLSGAQTLTVAGRRSGRRQSVPVIPVEVGGHRYVVSTRGEAQWVRNVRAAGDVTVGSTVYDAREVAVDERPVVLTAYREKAGRAVAGYFRRLPRDADHPVFVLTPK
jgi:deazaflavin-dependent oxidoreductase (nitroreductase family)